MSLGTEAADGSGCLWVAILIGVGVLVMRSGCGPWNAGEPDPIAAHRQKCMTCVKIDDQLLVVEQLQQRSVGLLENNKQVCDLCKQGLKEVHKVGLMIDAAQEAGCVGLEEYRRDADTAAASFTRSMSWYRCK